MGHKASIFVICEGKNTDRWFYDSLLREDPTLDRLGVFAYPVASVTTGIQGGGQGKLAVLELFRKLRSAKELKQVNSSGVKTIICCVDADHDRFTGGMLRSDHLVYTYLPDVEAHVLDSCEVADVVSSVASLPTSEANMVVDAITGWQERVARAHLEWMTLCCVATITQVFNAPKAGTLPPKFNKSPFTSTRREDVDAARQLLKQANTATATVDEDFDEIEQRVKSRFTRALASGHPEHILKGKWCLKALKILIEDEAGKVAGETFMVALDSILSAARAGARFDSKWCNTVRSKVIRTLDLESAKSA